MTDPLHGGPVEEAVVARIAETIREEFNDLPDYVNEWLAAEGEDDDWLASWNSKPGRTHDEVLELVDRTIERQLARVGPCP